MLLINSPKPGLYVVANFFSRLSIRDRRRVLLLDELHEAAIVMTMKGMKYLFIDESYRFV